MKRYCSGNKEGGGYNPEFCFGVSNPPGGRYPNLVGCQQMGLHISNYSGLYHTGKWINLKGDFLYDKEQMLNLVEKTRDDFPDCPYMNFDNALSFITHWPDIVNPNLDNRLSIWPSEIGEFESELLKNGLSLSGPSPTPNGEEYPVFTDTNYFLELINAVYNEICEQTIHYFD